MKKSEAQHLHQVALNAIDLVHCLHTGSANEITFQAWWDEFARGKEFEAARKQWQRWKADFKRYEIPCEFVDDGREKHVIVLREAIEVAERLMEAAAAALGPRDTPQRCPDTVTIQGKTYRLKVYGRGLRALTKREYEDLKASIAVDGIKIAVFCDRDGNIVDGKTRLIIAVELGLERVPIVVLDETDRAKLEELAVNLNECRRQFSRKELTENRRIRQEEALAKKAAGMSNRQIAEEAGVSATTIQRDLDAAGESVEDGEVVGTDGRRHHSRQRTAAERAKRRKDIAELRAKKPKITVHEIAEQLDLSVGTVARELKALEAGAACDVPEQEPEDAILVPAGATSHLDCDPEQDDLRPCLEAVLVGLGRIRDGVGGTDLEGLVAEVHAIVETLICRVAAAEAPA